MTKPINAPYIEMEGFTWTVKQYNRLIDAGILTPDNKVELLEGSLIKKIAIIESHAACVDGLQEYFYDKYGKQFTLRSENPITLSEKSAPEPDFVVCERREDRYRSSHPVPSQIELIIEVADSTVDKDRNYKSTLYALAGIKEYWIINIRDAQVEVYLNPDAASEAFLEVRRFRTDEDFESPFNGNTIVNDLLP